MSSIGQPCGMTLRSKRVLPGVVANKPAAGNDLLRALNANPRGYNPYFEGQVINLQRECDPPGSRDAVEDITTECFRAGMDYQGDLDGYIHRAKKIEDLKSAIIQTFPLHEQPDAKLRLDVYARQVQHAAARQRFQELLLTNSHRVL